MKWAIELSEIDIISKVRTTIKGQALVDFMAEFIRLLEMEVEMVTVDPLLGVCSLMAPSEKLGLEQALS